MDGGTTARQTARRTDWQMQMDEQRDGQTDTCGWGDGDDQSESLALDAGLRLLLRAALR